MRLLVGNAKHQASLCFYRLRREESTANRVQRKRVKTWKTRQLDYLPLPKSNRSNRSPMAGMLAGT
jgi:hypothetical protein